MSYGPQTHNPWEHDESEPEDEQRFQCPCGDENCFGYGDDPANIKIGPTWYSASCVMAANHPEVIRARELDALWDGVRR